MSTEEPIKEECQCLKNIQYKTMLLKGKNTTFVPSSSSNTASVDLFLEKEMKMKKNLSWARLDRSDKNRKLEEYAIKYGETIDLTEEELDALRVYLISSLDRNRLHKVKEVKYNKITDTIESLPCLNYDAISRKFTLNRLDKRESTIKSLGNEIKFKKN